VDSKRIHCGDTEDTEKKAHAKALRRKGKEIVADFFGVVL
jgi:hypothetical protein